MEVALLGYGKMGRLIEEHLRHRGHGIAVAIDNEEDWRREIGKFRKADVAIDFSVPGAAVGNMMRAFESHVPIVVGTTGWLDKMDTVRSACTAHNGKLLYGSNFSIGVHIFFRLNRFLASMMKNDSNYKAAVEETHHTHKIDAPSGTAIHIANDIIDIVPAYKRWSLASAENDSDTLEITAHRIGETPGTHTVAWHSDVDDITISHIAHNRNGFALGAVAAAEWLTDKPEGIYTFDQCIEL